MISVNRSGANYNALSSLRRINKDIAENQTRVTTGLKVRSAADDATAFAAARSIRSDLAANDTITSGLAIARGRADVTVEALNKITTALTGIQKILTEASVGDSGNGSRNSQIKGYQNQIKAIVSATSVKDGNWLTSTSATTTVIKLGTDPDASLTFAPTQILRADAAQGLLWNATAHNSAIGLSIDTTDSTPAFVKLNASRTAVASAISAVASYTTSIKDLTTLLSSQSDLLGQMDDVRKSALGNLVDADLSAESARGRALQARQQLAYQALSIGNSKPTNILALFR